MLSCLKLVFIVYTLILEREVWCRIVNVSEALGLCIVVLTLFQTSTVFRICFGGVLKL